MRFAIFPVHLSEVRLARKSDARSYEVLHLSRKIISANLKIWCSKLQPLSGNERPDLRTSLMNMSLELHLPREINLARSSAYVPRLPSILEMPQNPHVLLSFDKVYNPLRLPRETTSERPKVPRAPHFFLRLWLRNVLRATTACTFWTSQLPKVLWPRQLFTLLTWRRASRHNGVRFFRHLNLQKWSDVSVFCAFWLRNALRTTMTCNFSSFIWPHGSAPAALASLLFDPPGPQIIGKNTVNRDFSTFSRTCIFFLLTLSLLFSSLTVPTSASPSLHIVRSLTSMTNWHTWMSGQCSLVTRLLPNRCQNNGTSYKLPSARG